MHGSLSLPAVVSAFPSVSCQLSPPPWQSANQCAAAVVDGINNTLKSENEVIIWGLATCSNWAGTKVGCAVPASSSPRLCHVWDHWLYWENFGARGGWARNKPLPEVKRNTSVSLHPQSFILEDHKVLCLCITGLPETQVKDWKMNKSCQSPCVKCFVSTIDQPVFLLRDVGYSICSALYSSAFSLQCKVHLILRCLLDMFERCVCLWVCFLKFLTFIIPLGPSEINADATTVQTVHLKWDLLLEMKPETLPLEIQYFQHKQGINQVNHYRSGWNRNPENTNYILVMCWFRTTLCTALAKGSCTWFSKSSIERLHCSLASVCQGAAPWTEASKCYSMNQSLIMTLEMSSIEGVWFFLNIIYRISKVSVAPRQNSKNMFNIFRNNAGFVYHIFFLVKGTIN